MVFVIVSSVPERLCVFAIWGFAVELPTAWARFHERVEVALSYSETFGWTASLVGDRDELLLGFPWHDHVDTMLAARDSVSLPIDLDGDTWVHNIEQHWCGAVIAAGQAVFIAEADYPAIEDDVHDPERQLQSSPGVVSVDGVDVHWARVDRDAYEEAWARAMSRFSPTG